MAGGLPQVPSEAHNLISLYTHLVEVGLVRAAPEDEVAVGVPRRRDDRYLFAMHFMGMPYLDRLHQGEGAVALWGTQRVTRTMGVGGGLEAGGGELFGRDCTAAVGG